MRLLLLLPLSFACAAGSGGPAASSPGPTPSGPAGASAPAPAGAAVGPALGVVHTTGADVWYVVPDGQEGTRYCLVDAPAALLVEGQRVRFAGTPGEIPPNVRRMCTPFAFTTLEPAA